MMHTPRNAHAYAERPSPTPSPAWTVVLAAPCARHDRPAGSPCWTLPGEHGACCSSRLAAMRRRT